MNIRTINIRIKAWLLILLFIGACSLNTGSDLGSDPSIEIDNNDHGYLNLEVPIVPAYLSESLSARMQRKTPPAIPFTSGGKAIGFASYIEVTFTNDLGVESPPFTIYPNEATPSGKVSGILNLTAGWYNASVKVFNTEVSNSAATVEGHTDASFQIKTGETTYVTIKPVPTSYFTLSPTSTINKGSIMPSAVDPYYLNITSVGQESWYYVENTGYDGISTVTVTHTSIDAFSGFVDIAIFDASTNSLVKNIMSPGILTMTGDLELSYSFLVADGSMYYICVMPLTLTGDTDAEYTIAYKQGLTDDGNEPNNVKEAATALNEGTTIDGVSYDYDYYEINVPEVSLINFETYFDEDGSKLMFYIQDKNGNIIDQKDVYPFGDSYTRIMDPETYYIRIVPQNNTGAYCVPYQLTWKTLATYTDDAYEENDSMTDAYPLAEGNTISAYSVDTDYYQFTLGTEQAVHIDCEFLHAEGNIDIELSAISPWGTYGTSYSEDDNESFTTGLLVPATYYIKVITSDKPGTPYKLSWTTVP